MVEQQSTSRGPVILSALALLVAVALFGGAFYFFDGFELLSEYVAAFRGGGEQPSAPVSRPSTDSPPPQVGSGIPKEFAFRLWQEQVDSQPMIRRLVDGELEAMQITRVESSSAEATLGVRVSQTDGTQADGVLGLRRFKDSWFVAFASLERDGVAQRPSGPLPSEDDVDLALLNTMLEEQYGADGVIDEYLEGVVKSLSFEEPQRGPNTVTIDVDMQETHGEGYAQIVAVEHEMDGKPYWFLVRFTKTGHEPPNL